MKPRFKQLAVYFFLILMAAIIILTLITKPRCSKVEVLESSIQIVYGEKKFIGLNADTDNLNFGVSSPGSTIKRVVKIQNSLESRVYVTSKGQLTSWLEVNPYQFELEANLPQEVEFILNLPENSPEGEFAGKIYFCFES
ncbi:MAG TPA: hypothetical protein VJC39_02445 [Candidatus Nanoarchaeia archaeon]|nr:hypothetical protein [Candidatus Nanoarchaeia archaeon]